MRVALVLLLAALTRQGPHAGHGVEHAIAGPRRVDRIVERGLVAGDDHEQVGGPHVLDLVRCQLDVVRLDAGRSQVRHPHQRTADPLGELRERVVAGDHRQAAARLGRGVAAAGDQRRHRGGERKDLEKSEQRRP